MRSRQVSRMIFMMLHLYIIFDLKVPNYDTSSAVHFRSSSVTSPDRVILAFSHNVHHQDSLSRQLVAVYDPLL